MCVVKRIWHKIVSEKARERIWDKYWKIRKAMLKRKIIKYYNNSTSDDEQRVVDYLRRHELGEFPDDRLEKYNDLLIEVFLDGEYPYVIRNDKRLYGPKEWSVDEFREYYRSLALEQDPVSPHFYLSSNRIPQSTDIVADIGAAEGIFSLDIIDKVRHVFLFEYDEKWMEPLRRTFSNYSEKVSIIQKYVGKATNANSISIDDFFDNVAVTYIKADIEGAEMDMLKGAERTIERSVKKVIVCAYHNYEDEQLERDFLTSHGFAVENNTGFIIRTSDLQNLRPPYLRRGVMFGNK